VNAENAKCAEKAEYAECAGKAECAVNAENAKCAEKAEYAKCAEKSEYAKCAEKAELAKCADKAEFAKCAEKSENAKCAEKSEYAECAEKAEHAKCAVNAEHAECAEHAINADFAKYANIGRLDTTKYFWIEGVPNSTQIAAYTTLITQTLPINVGPGKTLRVTRIRCSLGFYTPVSSLVLRVFAASTTNHLPLDGIVYSTANVVDEVPVQSHIYHNATATQQLITIVIGEDNKTNSILHTDMPDAWWVEFNIS